MPLVEHGTIDRLIRRMGQEMEEALLRLYPDVEPCEFQPSAMPASSQSPVVVAAMMLGLIRQLKENMDRDDCDFNVHTGGLLLGMADVAFPTGTEELRKTWLATYAEYQPLLFLPRSES